MSSTIKVSVIVPVYNVEPYLRECLNSIASQTLKEIEIICVNDGSTDGSRDILEEFFLKDSRFVIIDQQNSGAGAARNKGLEVARGEYLSFLDSDDFFEPHMLKEAYQQIYALDAEIIIFRSDRYFYKTNNFLETPWALKKDQFPDKLVFPFAEIHPNAFLSTQGWAWDKLFKRSFIFEKELRFQEIRLHNDLTFVFSALVSSSRITILDKILVHQRKRRGGSVSDQDTKGPYLHCFVDALLELKSYLIKNDLFNRYERDFINYVLHLSIHHLNTTGGSDHKLLHDQLRNEWFEKLDITNYKRNYFYNKMDYRRYEEIMKNPYPLKDGSLYPLNVWFFNYALRAFFRSLKNNGLQYTIKMVSVKLQGFFKQ